MLRPRPHQTTDYARILVLLAAFTVVLLAGISSTMATSNSALSLVDGLRRDLGAVRVELERAAPIPGEASRQSVAFNTDLGDGGAAFRHRTMATILRGAKRRLEKLATGYHHKGDARRVEAAQKAQLDLRELLGLMQYLGGDGDATSIMWTRKRLEAEAVLDRMREALMILLPEPPALQMPQRG